MSVTPPSSVKSLILLMLFSVSCALAIAIFSVQKFGPTGAYDVKNALVTPYLLENMSFDEVDNRTGASTRFVFDQLLYSYQDPDTRQIRTVPLTMSQYRQFYDTISGDSSIVEGGAGLGALFDGELSRLILKVKTVTDDPLQSEKLVFQQIEFGTDGNFYRIELREQLNPPEPWAFFHHIGIKDKIHKLFVDKK